MAVYLLIIRHNEVAKNLRGLGLIGSHWASEMPSLLKWDATAPTMRTRTDFLFDICFPSFLRNKNSCKKRPKKERGN